MIHETTDQVDANWPITMREMRTERRVFGRAGLLARLDVRERLGLDVLFSDGGRQHTTLEVANGSQSVRRGQADDVACAGAKATVVTKLRIGALVERKRTRLAHLRVARGIARRVAARLEM
jgi:hypothetical protein